MKRGGLFFCYFGSLGIWSTGFIMVMSLGRSCCKAGMSGASIVTANIVVVFCESLLRTGTSKGADL